MKGLNSKVYYCNDEILEYLLNKIDRNLDKLKELPDELYNCVVKAKKIVRIDLPLYVYIIRAGSVSRVVYSPRNAGMYIYPKEILIDVRKKYKENIREAEYYCFRGLLVLFFRFYKSHSKDKSIKDFKKDFYRFIPKIMFNKYLPGKYKLFAVAVFLHIQKLSLPL